MIACLLSCLVRPLTGEQSNIVDIFCNNFYRSSNESESLLLPLAKHARANAKLTCAPPPLLRRIVHRSGLDGYYDVHGRNEL